MNSNHRSAGILLVDKPQGITSARAIARVKAAAPWIKKIGHAGTLDPMATGLLVCLVNSATRLASYAEQGRKIYSGRIRFGVCSDTDDIDGNVDLSGEEVPGFAEIEAAACAFKGVIKQVPPAVSAIKVNGVRSYKRARQGEEVVLQPREVSIYSFDLNPIAADEVEFMIECSKGTYIRSIARDLGAALGCGGLLAALRREASWPFHVDTAVSIEELSLQDLLDWKVLFPSALQIRLAGSQLRKLTDGDQQTISAICKEIGRLSGQQLAGKDLALREQSRIALCLDEDSGNAAGLFVREQQEHWKFGLNIT